LIRSAFRFVLEGEGVWTVVDGDPVAMRRGDLLLTPGWQFHGHHNVSDVPMAWLDGLDIPLVAKTDQGFFEFGPDQVRIRATHPFLLPAQGRAGAHAGRPVGSGHRRTPRNRLDSGSVQVPYELEN
jgi:gentisate 1,2-dioxygenase